MPDQNAASDTEREQYLRSLEDALGAAYNRKDGAEVVRLRKEITRVGTPDTDEGGLTPNE